MWRVGKRIFASADELRISRWDHPGLRWALNAMTVSLIRGKRGELKQKHRGSPCKGRQILEGGNHELKSKQFHLIGIGLKQYFWVNQIFCLRNFKLKTTRIGYFFFFFNWSSRCSAGAKEAIKLTLEQHRGWDTTLTQWKTHFNLQLALHIHTPSFVVHSTNYRSCSI